MIGLDGTRLGAAFEAYRDLFDNRNFLRLFSGRIVSNAGDSLYYIGGMWLVYSLSGSSFYTGLAGFLMLFPQLLEFLIGPLVDRGDKRRILVLAELGQGLLVLAVPLAWALGRLTVELVLVVMPVVALIEQFVYPTQNALLPRIVDEDRLVKANSLFSVAYQGIEMGLNALAGILVALVGAVALFVIDSLTFFAAAAIFATLSLGRAEAATGPDDGSDGPSEAFEEYVAELKDGLAYVYESVILWMSLRRGVLNFVNGAAMAVLPAFAAAHGGPELYGLLLAAMSVGTFSGSLLAPRFETVGFGRLTIYADVISGTTWMAAISVQSVLATSLLFGIAWIPVGVTSVVFFSAVQAGVAEDMIGRVSAVNSSIAVGTMPFGSLVGGALAATFGAEAVVFALGPMFVVMALLWLATPSLRRIPRVTEVDFAGGS